MAAKSAGAVPRSDRPPGRSGQPSRLAAAEPALEPAIDGDGDGLHPAGIAAFRDRRVAPLAGRLLILARGLHQAVQQRLEPLAMALQLVRRRGAGPFEAEQHAEIEELVLEAVAQRLAPQRGVMRDAGMQRAAQILDQDFG